MSAKRFTFYGFEADLIKRLLLRDGNPVPLNSKTFDLLSVFLANSDRVLTKSDLLEHVWTDQFVEESNLPVHISALRKAFREKKDEHRFIVTVPGIGYRFVAPVREHAADESVDEINDDASSHHVAGFWSGWKLAILFGAILTSIGVAATYFSSSGKVSAKIATLTRLTTGGNATLATITPDGRYVVFSQKDETGESLWLKQIATGSQTRILPAEPVEFVGLSVSPDNSFIYYSLFRDNQDGSYLRRVPLTGGVISEIAPIETGTSISFAPDGQQFAFTKHSSSKGESYVLKAKVDGSGVVKLTTAKTEIRAFETFKSNPVAWSPQGNDIAAAITEEKDGRRRSGIELIDAESGHERGLVPHSFAFLDNLAWIDNDRLAFVGYEDDWSSQIYAVSRSTGEIRRLTNDLQTYSWLGYGGGLLVTVQRNSISTVKVASIDSDLTTREILSENGTMWAAFTPDGSILYTSTASGKREIWGVGQSNGNAAQLTAEALVTYGLTVSPIDGSIIFSSNKNGRHSLWAADSDGRNLRQLTDQDDISPAFSADGRIVVFQRGLNSASTIWGLSVDTGAIFQITKGYSLKPAISPDGSLTAHYFMDPEADGAWRIALVSTKTGQLSKRLDFPTTVNDRRMMWHPSGKFIGQAFSSGGNGSLLLMPVEGGSPKLIEALGKGKLNSISWSKGGRSFVYSLLNETQDVVTLSDF